jgi:mannitol/fructose-specific phosphotransferase system IIA component (Ntr-type)
MLPEDALRLARKLQEEGRSKQDAQAEVAKRIVETLNPAQGKRLRQLVNDKDAIERLLSSQQAKEIMRRFKDER